MTDIEKLSDAIEKSYDRERQIVRLINSIGESDTNPVRDGPNADKIREFDSERRNLVQKRRLMQRGKAEILGQLHALKRHSKGRGDVRSLIGDALKALEEN